MRLLTAALLLCALPAAARAGSGYFGEVVNTLPSVRANAMGDAYAAAWDDPLGFYYNPAHGVELPAAAGVLLRGYSEGDSTAVLGAALPSVFGFGLGAGYLYYSAGTMDMYTYGGELRSVDAETDSVAQLNISRALSRRVSMGVNVKAVHMTLFGDKSGSAVLGDAGLLGRFRFANIGASFRNFGEKLKLGSEKETFPYAWRAGIYKEVPLNDNRLAFSLDRAGGAGDANSWHAGAELKLRVGLALRGGCTLARPADGGTSAHAGFGFTRRDITLDYALVPYRYMGATHRFGLRYTFQ